jgi:hypothetical protein
MSRWILIAAGLMLLSGCCREETATTYDLQRFGHHGEIEARRLSIDIQNYVRSNALEAQYLPLDVGRFLEWRKREWWNLRDEQAELLLHEWTQIEKLSRDVAVYYGYNIRNFPRTNEDILHFFAHADIEWRNLVMDVSIFLEYQNREVVPLRADLRQFYEHSNWEIANLDIDVRSFLEWREREYKKLIQNGRDWFAANLDDWDQLTYDVNLFRVHALIEGEHLDVDFRVFFDQERASVPRLVDDVYRYTQWREREYAKLRVDVLAFSMQHTSDESQHLLDDLWRYKRSQLELIPKLMHDVEAFFQTYEREVGPLNEDVKRWWRFNISRGSLFVQDLRHFYEHKDEESAALQQDMLRFFSYGGKEWHDLVANIKRFSTCAYDPSFGDGITPSSGDVLPPVMDDKVVRDWDINN